jgi:hypothetical protein
LPISSRTPSIVLPKCHSDIPPSRPAISRHFRNHGALGSAAPLCPHQIDGVHGPATDHGCGYTTCVLENRDTRRSPQVADAVSVTKISAAGGRGDPRPSIPASRQRHQLALPS